MTDISELEAKLESIREVFDEICKEADADGVRDKDEQAMISRVSKKIKKLEAELRVAKAKAELETDPKVAWEEVSDLYKDLLKLHAALKFDALSDADDLNVYLKAISSHLATEDWESAVNEVFLAASWAKENELWEEYPGEELDEDEQEEADKDASGKTTWDTLDGDKSVKEMKDLHAELKKDGSKHAAKIGKSLDKIDAALKKEDWKKATTEMLLIDIYLRDNDLYPEDGEDQDEDWIARAGDLSELTKLVGKLVSGGVSGASEIAATLAQITAAAVGGDFDKAGKLLDDALVRARELAEDEDDAGEISDNPEKVWKEVHPLYRRLLKLHAELAKDEDALGDDLNVHLQAVDAYVAVEDWPNAVNETLVAAVFADRNELWDIYEDDTEIEDEEADETGLTIWEKLDGDQALADAQTLVSDLKKHGSEHAKKVEALVKTIEDAVDEENWKGATAGLIMLDKYTNDNQVWKDIEVEGWVSRIADLDELKSLVDDLLSAGIGGATEIAGTLKKIMKEAASGNFDTAGDLLDDALDAAREAAEEIEKAGHIDPSSAKISASVGQGGKNKEEDVVTVQKLLNRSGAGLVEDGDCGGKTIGAIEKFQKSRLGWKDGRVDPDGKTFAALTGAATFEDVKDTVTEAVEDAAEVVKDTAGKVKDKVSDMIDDAGEFLDDFFGSDEEEEEEQQL